MSQKSILLIVDDKAVAAQATASAAAADATQALADAAAAQAAANSALAVTTRMYWGNAKGAISVTAADLVASKTQPLIINASGGTTVGPITYSQLTAAGYTVNTLQSWSDVIHLINRSASPLTITLGDPTAANQSFVIDGSGASAGEPVVLWFDFNAVQWMMASSAV